LSHLVQITDLNISGNPIEDLAAVIESLQTMPRLENLQINLHLEEEVDYLLRQLPELKILNNIPVERDAIYSESESQSSARLC
jgi:Leucine-rich repeat (LRR) protein